MSARHASALPLAAILTLTALPAQADVTPDEVWEGMQSYFQDFGYEMTYDEARSGDTLTVSNVQMAFDLPEAETSGTMSFTELSFTDNGDGTVTVGFPEVLPFSFSATTDEAGETSGTFEMVQSGMDMVVSGAPGDLVFTYTAESFGMNIVDLVAEGEALDIKEMGITMTALEGKSTMKDGDLRDVSETVKAGPTSYVIDMTDPENADTKIAMKGQFETMAMDISGTFPANGAMADPAAILDEGFDMAGSYSYTGGQSSFSITEDGAPMVGTTSSTGGKVGFAMGAEGLSYDFSMADLALSVAGGEIPFPVEANMAETAMNLTVPLAARDDPQGFALGLTLGDFTMSEMLWMLFDPTSKLPRDPATVAIDMEGQAKLTTSLTDAEALEALGTDAPGELTSLKLNSLDIDMVGARLTGDGAVDFDNTDLDSYDGMPAPLGGVNLTLTGGNTLLDTLIAMGFVKEEDAMGIRMMTGIFTVPAGDDTLTSTIEFKDGGQIYANGQRLK